MRDVERIAIELGLTHTLMMENAGANLAWLASTMLGGEISGRRITALAGPGGKALRGGAPRPLVGELYLADISIPTTVYDRLGTGYRSPFSGSPIVQPV